MEPILLNKSFDAVDNIDYYSSFIWTDRFRDVGNCELCINAFEKNVESIAVDYYLSFSESDHGMIIASKELKFDPEQGYYWVIEGESFESILKRRIVWSKTTLSGNVQNAIKKILNENIISPSISNRKISNFIFQASSDPSITGLTLDEDIECQGEQILDVVKTICEDKEIGFRVVLNDQKKFVFSLYNGTDRSYEQSTNPYVIFSPSFDNLSSSGFYTSKSDYVNVVLVSGSRGTDSTVYRTVGSGTGLDRRESFLEESVPQEITNVSNYLDTKGKNELNDKKVKTVVDGEADMYSTYRYGIDFYIGDVVQLDDGFDNVQKGRIDEIMFSQDSQNGERRIPTFNANLEKE